MLTETLRKNWKIALIILVLWLVLTSETKEDYSTLYYRRPSWYWYLRHPWYWYPRRNRYYGRNYTLPYRYHSHNYIIPHRYYY